MQYIGYIQFLRALYDVKFTIFSPKPRLLHMIDTAAAAGGGGAGFSGGAYVAVATDSTYVTVLEIRRAV